MVHVVSFGGGINSTAMLVGMVEQRVKYDLALFADTGGEKPETYEHVETMNEWLVARGYPPIETVRYVPQRFKHEAYSTLEGNCLANETLPSIAFGYKSCSMKWKVDPQDARARTFAPAVEAFARGERVQKSIGYHADEQRRIAGGRRDEHLYEYRYPLAEWGWRQIDCLAAIQRAGIPIPPKSACFFCPSSTKAEIVQLRRKHPDLYDRAIEMENRARDGRHGLSTVRGLGRKFSWRDVDAAKPDDADPMPCGCYDGGVEDEEDAA